MFNIISFNFMKNFTNQTSKLIKGMKLLILFGFILSLIPFIIQSCQREQYENSDTGIANAKFTNAVKEYKNNIGKITFRKKSSDISSRLMSPSGIITAYIEFPENVSQETINFYENSNSIEDLATLIDNHNGTLQYEPNTNNSGYQINLPLNAIEESLDPLVQESKDFLYSKGFTDQDIQQMIVDENAEETDLIPLVMAITQAEKGNLVAINNFGFLPVNMSYASVNWNQVGHCAMHALGVDILFSLGASSATVWSKAAIKRAFGTVAKRMLGPIGVAIAVVDFGFCMNGVEL